MASSEKKIRNLIIDLGGVVIDLDRERCVRAFQQLGVADVDRMLSLYRQEEPFLSIETGRISTAAFYDEMRRRAVPGVSDVDIEKAFESFLVALPTERLAALRKARNAGLRTYMLSNTNGIMYDGWIKRAFHAEGLQTGDYFDGIITSFAEGVCKPEAKIFRTVIDRYRLDPSETLLLDDSEANCEAARALGINARRIIGDTTLVTAIDDCIKTSC